MSTNSKEKAFYDKLLMLRKTEAIEKSIEIETKNDANKKENEKAARFYAKIRMAIHHAKLK